MPRLHVPPTGPGRLLALTRLARALRAELGDTGAVMLIALLDEQLQGDGDDPDAARQEPQDGRAAPDAPTHGRERDRRPTPAAGRPLPHS